MFGLSPKEDKFYLLFAQSTEIISKSLKRLQGIMQQDRVSSEDAAQMNRFEHEADNVTNQILDRLNSTFITPMDREAVSYTHLRAHETRHDLVCRLLLEKK